MVLAARGFPAIIDAADMTLSELVNIIERIAADQPAVNMIVRNSVEDLNTVPRRKYGAFVWTQGEHGESMSSDIRNYRFSLFYVDRLTHSYDNAVEVQSVAVEVLSNIIRRLAEVVGVDDWSVKPFMYQFADMCGGAFATVEIGAPISYSCAEVYGTLGGHLLTSEGWRVEDINGAYVFVRIDENDK